MQAEPLKVDRSESGARERGGLTGRHGTALRPRDMLLAVLLLGSVWGMVEVVLGGALHLADAPHRVAIVTGLGMGIMGVGLGAFRRVYMLPLIALVVVAVRQLAVPILHVPFVCHANSCLAILIEGCALAGVVAAAGSRLTGQPPSPGVPAAVPRARWISAAVVGGCAALLASGVFHAVGMRVAPCDHLLSYNKALGLLTYVGTRGGFWAVSSAVFFPLGYVSGLRLEETVAAVQRSRPAVYYWASVLVVVGCWGASAVALSAGL